MTEFVCGHVYWPYSVNSRACANSVYQALLSPLLEPGNKANICVAYLCHKEQYENHGGQYEDEPSEEPVGSTGEVGEKQCHDRVHHTDHGNEEN